VKKPPAAGGPPPPEAGDRVLATPAARMLARELGLDLSRIQGTGPEGRIERRDLEALGGPPEAGG